MRGGAGRERAGVFRGRRRALRVGVLGGVLLLLGMTLVPTWAPSLVGIEPARAAEQTPQVGELASFRVDLAGRRVSLVASVRFVGDDSVIYVEKGRSIPIALISSLAGTIDDVIYPRLTSALGEEPKPGIDGSSRLVVLVYDFGDPQLSGYFDPGDIDPVSPGHPESNHREMFYLNASTLLGDPAKAAAAASHEFAHMILYYRDFMLDPSSSREAEARWVEEGIAMYAESLAGYGTQARDYLRSFELQSNKNLTLWGRLLNDYGASLAFVSYLVERVGPGFLRELVAQPLDGIAGIDATLEARGDSFDTYASIFDEWVIADFLDDRGPAAPPYVHGALDLAVEPVVVGGAAPWVGDAVVENQAAVYLDLPPTSSAATIRVVVDGQDVAPLRAALMSWDSGGSAGPMVTFFEMQAVLNGGTIVVAPGYDRHTLAVWARGPESADLAYTFRYSAAVDPVGDVQFLDVGGDHPFFPYIDLLRTMGVVSGRQIPVGSGLWFYRSDERVLRAQFAKMAVMAVGLHTDEVELLGAPSFSDVPVRLDGGGRPEAYPFDYVEEAASAGIVRGYTDGTFRPYADMMRIHLVRMILRAAAAGGSPFVPYDGTESVFADVPPDSPMYVDVMTAYTYGIMSGSLSGGVRSFDAWGSATRGHVAKMTANLVALLDSHGD
ncbi:MAG: S-layer homology domain-containing protein [Thermoleophilia bacterium]